MDHLLYSRSILYTDIILDNMYFAFEVTQKHIFRLVVRGGQCVYPYQMSAFVHSYQ